MFRKQIMRFSTVVDGRLYLLNQRYVQDMYYKRS